jgi:hypothetical protein
MKIYFSTRGKCLAGLFVAISSLVIVSATNAQAQTPPPTILLTVNVTNLSTTGVVNISSTGTDPIADVNGSIGAGFDLVGLLESSASFLNNTLTSNLTTGISGQLYFNAYISDDLNGKNDVNFFDTSSDTTDFFPMTFSTTESAFQGSLTVNLGGLTLLPPNSPNSFGDIYTGYDGSADYPPTSPDYAPNTLIGQFEIVSAPEPSTWTLAFMVTGLLAVLRFRARRA